MPLFKQDLRLLQAFRDGDPGALERVYSAYIDDVASVFRHGTVIGQNRCPVPGVQLSHERADLIQEAFVKAFSPSARRAYDGMRNYRPFLLTIARNTLIDWHRKQRRLNAVAMAALLQPAETAPDFSEAHWCTSEHPLLLSITENYVSTLPDGLRKVHALRFEQSLSQRDSALALNVGRQTIRTMEKQLCAGLLTALAHLDVLSDSSPVRRSPVRRSPVGRLAGSTSTGTQNGAPATACCSG